MKIILLSGKAESGKDTFYESANDYIMNYYGMLVSSYRVAFGDFVKDIAYQLGWDGVKDEKGRAFLQWIGDGARAFNPRIWIDKGINKIKSNMGYNDTKAYTFVTDCRYPNEIELTKEAFPNIPFVVIRVNKPTDNSLTTEQQENTSETALDDYTGFDCVITNDGTLEQYQKVIQTITQLINDDLPIQSTYICSEVGA